MTKQTEALKLALEALEEIDGSVKLYHRLGPDWTHKDGTEVFEVSVLLDRSELIEKAITAINEALALIDRTFPPAQQEPLTKTKVGNYLRRHAHGEVGMYRNGFKDGVAFAEAAHGIKENT